MLSLAVALPPGRYISRRLIASAAYQVHAQKQQQQPRECFPRNPNKLGTLLDTPDYTNMNGTTTPFGANQKKRLQQQRELVAKIVSASGEIDYALERHEKLRKEKLRQKQDIIDSKFIEKGHRLL